MLKSGKWKESGEGKSGRKEKKRITNSKVDGLSYNSNDHMI